MVADGNRQWRNRLYLPKIININMIDYGRSELTINGPRPGIKQHHLLQQMVFYQVIQNPG
jgi:hypothetical protein